MALLLCVAPGTGIAACDAAMATGVAVAVAAPSTDDRPSVRGTIAFAIVEPVQRGLRVSIIQRLTNATDRALEVTDEDPLVFPLPVVSPSPRGPEPVDFVGGWRKPHVAHGVITDAISMLSGAAEVAYAVGFEPRSRRATLRWVLPYGATDVEVLVADQGIRVSSAGMHAVGMVTERGRRYARWSGGPVRPGEAVSVRLDGLPVSEDRWPEIAAGMLALALAYGLAAALRRRPAPACL